MFKNNFVVAVKVNGKILREVQDIVYLPFGTEYSLILKNVSPQKAQVKVSIDGSDVTEDVHLIVDGNDTLELKRFIKKGNLEAGNAFKFIEKTSKIEQYRGNKAEDGLITVTYEFARKPAAVEEYWSLVQWGSGCWGGSTLLSTSCSTQSFTNSSTTTATFDLQGSNSSDSSNVLRSWAPKVADGITAPGSVVEQAFRTVAALVTDGVKHSMTLQMKGRDGEEMAVSKPVTVQKVMRCTMCGTNTRQTAKFCHECGASVQIV